jgi:hypothetical protein
MPPEAGSEDINSANTLLEVSMELTSSEPASGINVMITIFCDFCKKLALFSKTSVRIKFWRKLAVVCTEKHFLKASHTLLVEMSF